MLPTTSTSSLPQVLAHLTPLFSMQVLTPHLYSKANHLGTFRFGLPTFDVFLENTAGLPPISGKLHTRLYLQALPSLHTLIWISSTQNPPWVSKLSESSHFTGSSYTHPLPLHRTLPEVPKSMRPGIISILICPSH